MAAGIEVIEGIEDDGESFEPVNVELGIFDIGVVRFEFDGWIKPLRNLLRNLKLQLALSFKMEGSEARETNQSFGLFDVFVTEEELAVQVAEINGIKVHDVDFAIAGEK